MKRNGQFYSYFRLKNQLISLKNKLKFITFYRTFCKENTHFDLVKFINNMSNQFFKYYKNTINIFFLTAKIFR